MSDSFTNTVFPESFTVHVKILQHHIDQGTCSDSLKCAGALAIMEAVPQASYVSVGADSAEMQLAGQLYQTALPGGMAEFIDRFDDELPVEPEEFDLKFDRLGRG